MANKNIGIIIGGITALGVGGYFLWKKLTEDKENGDINGEIVPPPPPVPDTVLIHYTNAEDNTAALLLSGLLNQKGFNTQIKYLSTGVGIDRMLNLLSNYKVAITIGGQITNPLYADAVSRGVMEALTPNELRWGGESVEIGNLRQLFYVAGYAAEDTVIAARLFDRDNTFFN